METTPNSLELASTLKLSLSEEQRARLECLCNGTGKTSAQVLADFIADLTETDGNGGSDERMEAANWFSRRGYQYGRYL